MVRNPRSKPSRRSLANAKHCNQACVMQNKNILLPWGTENLAGNKTEIVSHITYILCESFNNFSSSVGSKTCLIVEVLQQERKLFAELYETIF